uniref:C-type lectin domain-containing protein n=1 Tax=Sphaeramia orbicularis TaxID=375764 RepID=A0A673AID8_9TELE
MSDYHVALQRFKVVQPLRNEPYLDICKLSQYMQIIFRFSGKYYYVPLSKTWTAAQSYCRENFLDLATIENLEDWLEISQFLANDGIAYWIGLSRDSWKWSDQSNFEFTAWRSTEPRNQQGNEFCGYASAQGWGDTDCALELSFICSGKQSNIKFSYQTLQSIKQFFSFLSKV